MKYLKIAVLTMICLVCVLISDSVNAFNNSTLKNVDNRWDSIKNDYLNTDTDRLIFVKYKSGSNATVEMWKKIEATQVTPTMESSPVITYDGNIDYFWEKILSTKAYVGGKGINKKRQGDMKTPTGTFNITMAFGRKKSPGTAGIEYIKLNKYHYWSGEKDTYNTFVDARKLKRKWIAGEHMIDYNPWYDYGLAMDFNKKCKYLKGSAIFLHCEGKGRKYTHGCIAVPKAKMKKIVNNTTDNTKICIYKK